MKRGLAFALAISSAGLAIAQRAGTPTDDLGNLSVGDLFRLEVLYTPLFSGVLATGCNGLLSVGQCGLGTSGRPAGESPDRLHAFPIRWES